MRADTGRVSQRARPGAPVSVLIAWHELRPGLRSDHYRVRTLERRLRRLREDPWAAHGALRQRLTADVLAAVGARERKGSP